MVKLISGRRSSVLLPPLVTLTSASPETVSSAARIAHWAASLQSKFVFYGGFQFENHQFVNYRGEFCQLLLSLYSSGDNCPGHSGVTFYHSRLASSALLKSFQQSGDSKLGSILVLHWATVVFYVLQLQVSVKCPFSRVSSAGDSKLGFESGSHRG
ncbi:hypothetical protein RRG08_007493 [Elysia crispata]|uniref:Uncharacterized protein n=1 Tax=Elysia crispata TaxID=231223 RepID=A0AAE1E6J1_9GAST|nr:hypothetical protein RRG08_007493 [Elysia crispata]